MQGDGEGSGRGTRCCGGTGEVRSGVGWVVERSLSESEGLPDDVLDDGPESEDHVS